MIGSTTDQPGDLDTVAQAPEALTEQASDPMISGYKFAAAREELEEVAYRACRNPTVVCDYAHKEQWVGTRRETSKSPDKLGITFGAERNRCRVVDRLSRCAGVTH